EWPGTGAERFDDAIARACFLAAAAHDAHALAIERIAADLALDDAGAGARAPPYHRVIGALDRMMGKLLAEAGHGALVLGGDEKPAGIFVEPVNDAGPRHAANAFERSAAMGDQRVHQR